MNWSHQMAGLWAAFGIFCPQGRLQLWHLLTHYQFLQGGLICCFNQMAVALTTAVTVSDQHLPQQGGAILFWVLSSAPPV
jgi:hypothetical protein